MDEHQHPPSSTKPHAARHGVVYRCPVCNKGINCHHHLNEGNPQPIDGDILVCAHCRAVMEVVNDRQGVARILDQNDFEALPEFIRNTIALMMNDWDRQKQKILE